MIWASRDDRPAVRGRPGVLAILMRPPLLALASVQEGATVCMLSTTTVRTARAKFLAKRTSPRLSRIATSSSMYQTTVYRPSFGSFTAGSGHRAGRLLGRFGLGARDGALRQRRVGLQVVEQLQRPALVP